MMTRLVFSNIGDPEKGHYMSVDDFYNERVAAAAWGRRPR